MAAKRGVDGAHAGGRGYALLSTRAACGRAVGQPTHRVNEGAHAQYSRPDQAAGPGVQALATTTLKETYTGFIGVKTTPGGQDVTSAYDAHLGFIAASLADVPGGLDVLYEISREKFPTRFCLTRSFI